MRKSRYEDIDSSNTSLISGSVVSNPSNKKRIIVITISVLIFVAGITTILVTQLRSDVKDKGQNENTFESLKGFCKDVSPISNEEYSARQSNFINLVSTKELLNISGLLLEPGANMFYFTGVTWGLSERPFLYVLNTKTKSYAWICPAFEESRARQKVGTNATILTWEEDESPYKLVGQFFGLYEEDHESAIIALDHEIRYFIVDGLQKELSQKGMQLFSGKDLIASMRLIKSQSEINILRCANRATKRAIKLVAGELKEGMKQADIADLLSAALTTAGLSNLWWLILIGPDAAYPHGTDGTRELSKGELVLIDTGGSLYGYQSDITRTFPFGTPTEEQRKVWNTVKEAQNAALSSLGKNVTCGHIDDVARQIVINAGYGPDYDYFFHRLGHGIGVQGHEDPYLVRGNNQTLSSFMTFSLEPGIYIPDHLGVRIEDIVMVTEAGYEVFGALSDSIDDPFANH